MRKMLPKSQQCAYIGYDEGAKSVRYYNAETRTILTLQNYKFLIPSNSSPPEVLLIDPESKDPMLEGERTREEDNHKDQSIPIPLIPNDKGESKTSEPKTRPTRGPCVDYRYLNDPFPDEEETGIVHVEKEQAFAVLPDDDCRDLKQAKKLLEWPEWEQAIQLELTQLKHMGTWKLVDKPPNAILISNKFVFTKSVTMKETSSNIRLD
jgi:hypothetical protein